MEKFFKLSEHKTNVRTEIAAGVTTFMAMAYILMVNPGMFSQLEGQSYGAAYIATAIPAVIGTLLIGLMANLPLALSPTTSPASCRPKKAINRPMPAGTAFLTAGGMASKMVLRRPVTVNSTNSRPSVKTNNSALA